MQKNNRLIVRDTLVVLFGGFLTLAVAWVIYLGLYLGLESLFFAHNPTAFPADTLRRVASIALYVLYIAFLFTKASPLVKSTLSVAPTGAILITIILAYYQLPLYFLVGIVFFDATVYLIYHRKKVAWTYYLALGYATVLALLYAWPR